MKTRWGLMFASVLASVAFTFVPFAGADARDDLSRVKSDYDSPSASPQDRQRLATDYESARSNAYASIAVPAIFTATVAGLAIWYVLGRRETRVPIPTASVSAAGATGGLTARF